MKILEFTFRGEQYQVNQQGQIKANGLTYFSEDWIFLGGSSHHWHNHVTVPLEQAFKSPKDLNGCLGWDIDYGTVRQWGGRWAGKLPRIRNARIHTI